ncbi:MAG: thiamine diphosphokinase [Eggerthellaceae bacterium]|nr:thiamine diphosphokinase [Eggerthellaceae bacterium]
MPICALVGATDFNEAHFIQQHFDYVIAVDAGYKSLRTIGCVPDVLLGDFDSLGYVPNSACEILDPSLQEASTLADAGTSETDMQVHARTAAGFNDTTAGGRSGLQSILRFPSEKNESDMELALSVAEERGCDTLFVYGGLGRRLDHTLANLQLMVGCARRGMRVFGIDADYAVTVLDGAGPREIEFAPFDPAMLDDGPYGRFISVFACGAEASGVAETGLKYELEGACLSDEVSLGLSNEFMGLQASISVGSGNLLITFPIAAWQFCTSVYESG